MAVVFKRKSFIDECNDITNILYEEENGRIQKYIADFFKIDLDDLYSFGRNEGYKRITTVLENEYLNSKKEVTEKISIISSRWKNVSEDVFTSLENIFECQIDRNREISAEFTVNAVCPRYLDTWTFDVNYRKTEEEIILTCIHEIIHFIWFEKWSMVFPEAKPEEYNAPNLPWLFSEIAIDAILKETVLRKYCIVDKPAYKYFYDIFIKDTNMMEYVREIFKRGNIKDFMVNGMKYIQENRQLIQN